MLFRSYKDNADTIVGNMDSQIFLGGSDPKNTFDIEKYLNRKEKIHPGDEFIVVDADSLPPA